jgi:ketosteroid isomerase-like protein
MAAPDPTMIATAFNEAINHRDIDGLSVLMPADHVFVDSAGESTVGRPAALKAWRSFFAQFPDYRNHFSELALDGDQVSIAGYSTCSHEALAGPALWSAIIADGRVSEWRVHSDTPENRKMLGLAG